MNEQPFISRILPLESVDQKGIAIEVVLDNPTLKVVWIDQIELRGEAIKELFFSGGTSYLQTVTYIVQVDCNIAYETVEKIEVILKGRASEISNQDWSYKANGEFNYSISNPPGEKWDYQLSFPVILAISPGSRIAIRILFGIPSKFVAMKYTGGKPPQGSFGRGVYIHCLVRVITNTGAILEHEMDESLLGFLANSVDIVEEQSDGLEMGSLTRVRSVLDKNFDEKELLEILSDLNVEITSVHDRDKGSIIREMLLYLQSKKQLTTILNHPSIKLHNPIRILFLAANPLDTSRLRTSLKIKQHIRQILFA